MVMTSLVLALSTTLSGGCSEISNANRITSIKENAVEIVEKAAENYDFSDYLELTTDEQESLIKQKILKYNEENNLVDEEYIVTLKEHLEEDEKFTYFENIDDLFIKPNISKTTLKENNALHAELINDLSHSLVNDKTIIRDDIINSNITDIVINHDYGDTGDSKVGDDSKSDSDSNFKTDNTENEKLDLLPIYNYDQNHVTSTTNGTLDGVFFLGIIASRDACINFYNVIANFLNNQVMYSASGTKGPVRIIIESLKVLAPATMATVTAALISYFSGIWNTFISMFSAPAGPIGWIVGSIIALIGGACISTLVAMFIMGYQKKGFAIGWKVHNIFNWEWYCGKAN